MNEHAHFVSIIEKLSQKKGKRGEEEEEGGEVPCVFMAGIWEIK